MQIMCESCTRNVFSLSKHHIILVQFLIIRLVSSCRVDVDFSKLHPSLKTLSHSGARRAPADK